MITKGRALSDELQFIQEAGDRLANRLEKLAEKNSSQARHAYEHYENMADIDMVEHKTKTSASSPQPSGSSAFDIVDREFESQDLGSDDQFPSFLINPDKEDTDIPRNLQSKAERELAEALNKKRSSKKG
jgi:hypothetical protein